MRQRARQVLAILLLGVFLYVTGSLAPYFLRNLRLQRYVEEIARTALTSARSPEWIRSQVVERARQLGLPAEPNDVQVDLSNTSVRISLRYVVQVDLPGYTVKLHFAPSAGS